jgi:hypothetical protein
LIWLKKYGGSLIRSVIKRHVDGTEFVQISGMIKQWWSDIYPDFDIIA